jgi:circadian clock protein KaiC
VSAFSSAAGRRIPTGVPGLDTLLHGGLMAHGVYLLIGHSGAGKTTLANQIAFTHAATTPVRYVTVLAETHTRLIGQISQFAFFDRAVVGSGLTYLSGYEAFQDGSYQGLGRFLLPLIRSDAPTLLVVDGLPLTTPGSVYDPSLKNLMHELQVASEFGRCTTLILSPAHTGVWESRALMLVDGAFEVIRSGFGGQVGCHGATAPGTPPDSDTLSWSGAGGDYRTLRCTRTGRAGHRRGWHTVDAASTRF